MKNEECICTLLSCKKVNEKDQNNHFKLQPLPYAENALEPYMSEKTVQFHYGRHLPAYIEAAGVKRSAASRWIDLCAK